MTNGALAGTGLGINAGDIALEASVKLIPGLGNVVSGTAAFYDFFGDGGVIEEYGKCLAYMGERIMETNNKRDWSGAIISVFSAPVIILFMHFGKPELARSISLDFVCIIYSIRLRWDLKIAPGFGELSRL